MYDTVSKFGFSDESLLMPWKVKGSDWLGDQDAIHYMCREAPNTVIEVCAPALSFTPYNKSPTLN